MAIHGLSSPFPPCARLPWNLVVAVHVSTFCIYRHYRNVITGKALLYATLMQLAGALSPGCPQPVSSNVRKTPLPDIPWQSLLPCPPADCGADAPLRADRHNTAPPTPAQTAIPPQPPETGHVVSRTGSALMHASLSVGGPDINPNRFCHLLSGFQPLRHTIWLQEFKPSPTAHIRDFEQVAPHWGFHLLHSSPSSKNGGAILVYTSISPKRPPPSTSTSQEYFSLLNYICDPIHWCCPCTLPHFMAPTPSKRNVCASRTLTQ